MVVHVTFVLDNVCTTRLKRPFVPYIRVSACSRNHPIDLSLAGLRIVHRWLGCAVCVAQKMLPQPLAYSCSLVYAVKSAYLA
jgi:hypothetical protein